MPPLHRRRTSHPRLWNARQQGGYYGGHIAYAWRHKDVVYHITIHGYANEPRASLMMAALIARETGP